MRDNHKNECGVGIFMDLIIAGREFVKNVNILLGMINPSMESFSLTSNNLFEIFDCITNEVSKNHDSEIHQHYEEHGFKKQYEYLLSKHEVYLVLAAYRGESEYLKIFHDVGSVNYKTIGPYIEFKDFYPQLELQMLASFYGVIQYNINTSTI